MVLTNKTLHTPKMNTAYFGNFQLLGDSQFVRFCVEILDLKSTLDAKRRSQIGFCISGQDSTELAKLVDENYEYLHDNLIIMIGTNDIKKEVCKDTFTEAIYFLKTALEWKTILWLTIPPIPKFQNSEKHLNLLNYFNKEIKALHGNNIKVLDVYNIFMDENDMPKTYCFEEFYKAPYRRDDIHLNTKGLIKLCTYICFHLLPQKIHVLQHYRERKGSSARVKLYQEFLYLSNLLTISSRFTRAELYSYIMGPVKTCS